jgi:hypothetical protein
MTRITRVTCSQHVCHLVKGPRIVSEQTGVARRDGPHLPIDALGRTRDPGGPATHTLQTLMLAALIALDSGAFGCTASPTTDRERFLRDVDDALERADADRLARMASPGATAARDSSTLSLPPGPLVRTAQLSERELLYRDARARQWRLVLARDPTTQRWSVVPQSPPCPRGAAPRTGGTQSHRSEWSPLQCYPRPQ